MSKNGGKKRVNYNRARNMDVDSWRDRNVAQRTKEYFLRTEEHVPPTDSARYKAEYKRQEKSFRLERKALKAAKHADLAISPREYAEREAQWRMAHEKDSDEELLTYLHDAASGVKPLPEAMEVPGGAYIAGHFGNWRLALFLAGVPLPENVALPTQEEIDAVHIKMAERAIARCGK
jgi:hypothetical protein